MPNSKTLVAMSGGVDSSVAAWLASKEGPCAGATMQLCDQALLGCVPGNQADDARRVADKLGIPFYLLDAVKTFKDQVVQNFIDTYEQGHTPNPCIHCNRTIKFGWLLEKALEMGYDTLVTGHYARIEQDMSTGRYLLKKAADREKDQSYFLSVLDQRQLSHIRFPLGTLTKPQVRSIAEEQGFITARKRDSQDICFIPDGDYKAFMERYKGTQYPPGSYLDLNGRVLGSHAGAVGYTIGQRKGLGIALGEPAYVICKDMQANTVTLGSNEELFRRELAADSWNWIAVDTPTEPMRVLARVRYRHKEQPATVYPDGRVIFDDPQRAITTGQTVVLYDEDTVLGSGRIIEVL